MTHTCYCSVCGYEPPASSAYLYGCARCGGILDVRYDLAALRRKGTAELRASDVPALHRWRPLLPLPADLPVTSLGEGNTPLLAADSARLGCAGVRTYLKLEGCNPTGSFKDRAVAVGLARAQLSGAEAVVISSTGNAGAALAAYAAAAGLPAIVLVAEATPTSNLAQIASYGAQILRVAGDVSAPFHLARAAAEAFGWINLATTYLSPYPTEGDKTAGFEIAAQLGWRAPEWLLVPVGDGPLLAACAKAFAELAALGLVSHIPRCVAVQAAGCAPIFRAWQAETTVVEEWETPQTIAKGIADPLKGYPQDGTYTLKVVRQTNGVVLAVSDYEIRQARADLASCAGILAEPTGAVPLAGLRQLVASGSIRAEESAVLLVTGNGLKTLASTPIDLPVIEPSLAALEETRRSIRAGEMRR